MWSSGWVRGENWDSFSIWLSLRSRPVNCDLFKGFSSLWAQTAQEEMCCSPPTLHHILPYSFSSCSQRRRAVCPVFCSHCASHHAGEVLANMGSESFVIHLVRNKKLLVSPPCDDQHTLMLWLSRSPSLSRLDLASVKSESERMWTVARGQKQRRKTFFSPWISGMFIALLIIPCLDAVFSLSPNQFCDPECSDSSGHCFPHYICVKWFTRRRAWLFLLWSPTCLILLNQQLMPRAKNDDSSWIVGERNRWLRFCSSNIISASIALLKWSFQLVLICQVII